MLTKLTGKINVVFAEHLQGIAKESRKPYNFINVSNGLEKLAFSTTIAKTETEHLNPGDEIEINVSIDPWNPRNNTIESIAN
jgi:hypothetical protein